MPWSRNVFVARGGGIDAILAARDVQLGCAVRSLIENNPLR